MVMIDPAEEIRRLVEDEEYPLEEARAQVREDLRRRQAVQDRHVNKVGRRGKKAPPPINLQWTPRAQARGNLASRLVSTRGPRKSKT
jgi:hypothetical protein